MTDIPVSLACWDYDRTRPLIDGRIKAEGLDLNVQVMRPQQAFQRMLLTKEFDVSEISLASYVTLKAQGDCPFVAIPVMLSKMFRHSCIYVRKGAGIRTPADLKGKRVGATQFASTGVVFIKGMLQHEYGVTQSDMRWFIGGLDTPAHKPPAMPQTAPGVTIDFLYDGKTTLEGLFEAGELDALFALYIPKPFERGSPDIVRLFPDFRTIEQDYVRRTGIFPVMHTVVIREDSHRAHPSVANAIYKAFCDARDLAVDGLYDTDALRVSLPWLIDHIEDTRRSLGVDFFAYGMKANRPALDAIGQYLNEQGLAPRAVTPEELFLPGMD
jgi:4,5-dihydroxyphthalate decarboxylase